MKQSKPTLAKRRERAFVRAAVEAQENLGESKSAS